MQIEFDSDFPQRLMLQRFAAPTTLKTALDVQLWRSAWMAGLKSWHSPYKALIDASDLQIEADPAVKEALELMFRFFNGLFLKKAVAFAGANSSGLEMLPIEVCSDADSASVALGLRAMQGPREPQDLRANIQIQNHFNQHVMELSFAQPVQIKGPEDIAVLKSKIMNNLMQWHSKWSLLIDCANLEFLPAAAEPFQVMLRFYEKFFLKEALGYAPRPGQQEYPFKVYRARHNAAGRLAGEGAVAGDEVVCRSTKTTKT